MALDQKGGRGRGRGRTEGGWCTEGKIRKGRVDLTTKIEDDAEIEERGRTRDEQLAQKRERERQGCVEGRENAKREG